MENITIQVDPEIAKAYREAEPEKQQKIQTIVNDLLKSIIQDKSLEQIIEEMQKQAKANGLTQEILDQILEDE
ncbi:MAG: hypothetical protein F6K25_16735 [Okeania sp. SIO2G4]|uniref:hypothetical protein n=1 Tax=unclassified Okeania TaxID=2634635 RepID=UPI0013B7A58A|nr:MULTISPECIES: hypothetical protein [unclassified Okeania]NEP07429.1 hypothetical protein [Okeania sp. SIO4D6]NEP38280.1 hypothetical protein [Okeania sp. SIO2H7]NEP73727.1 hypothetical protein [Okeania sp. SIO2G5]NEP95829.1 hypothetical protein [Okeania sp. SIO2F5]NEQ92256.1 hypothetical protein [Okeania sp. SIO2G4]